MARHACLSASKLRKLEGVSGWGEADALARTTLGWLYLVPQGDNPAACWMFSRNDSPRDSHVGAWLTAGMNNAAWIRALPCQTRSQRVREKARMQHESYKRLVWTRVDGQIQYV